MRLSTFTERTSTAHIEITDESGENKIDEFDVTYRPGTWTPEFEDRMRAANYDGSEFTTNVFAAALSEAVVKWDLTEDVTGPDGVVTTQEVPHTTERLRTVPTNLLSQIIGGISDHMRPKAKPSGS